MSGFGSPLTLALSPKGEGMATGVRPILAFACSTGKSHLAGLPLFSFTPSSLRGEGWGEGPTAHLTGHFQTERPT